MAEFRTVRMSFWDDPFIESLSAEGKLLYIYLFTGSKTNNLGIVEISKLRIAFDTGVSEEKAGEILELLEAKGKIVVDGDMIWLPNFLRYNKPGSPNVVKNWGKLFAELPESELKPKIYLAIQACCEGLGKAFAEAFMEAFGKETRKGMPNQEQEQEQEVLPPLPPTGGGGGLDDSPKDQPGDQPEEQQPGETESAADPCPHQAIITAYHEILPQCPKVRVWDKSSRKNLATRWKEDQARQNMAWWRKVFDEVGQSGFLMGKTDARRGPFMFSLGWFVRPSNMAKVLNGHFRNRDGPEAVTQSCKDCRHNQPGGCDKPGTPCSSWAGRV